MTRKWSRRSRPSRGQVFVARNLGLYAKYAEAVDEALTLTEKAQHRLEHARAHPRRDPAEQAALIAKKEVNLGIALRTLREKAILLSFYNGRITEHEMERRQKRLARLGIDLRAVYETPEKRTDKHLRQRTGLDDHLELGIKKNKPRRRVPVAPVEVRRITEGT